MSTRCWTPLLFIICLSCSITPKIIEIDYKKDLIPEGITIDPSTQTIYLSSVHQHKIIAYDLKTKAAKDFISTDEKGYGTGVGMIAKDGKLFTLSSQKINGKNRSSLLVFDLQTAALLNSYQLKDTMSHFMNDLAISANNQIYITDSEIHRIYKLDYPNGAIDVFLEDEQIQYPNGIAVADEDSKLFIDSWTSGVRIVDITTKAILNKKNEATAEIGIDGLKYYKGDLYAIRNSGKDKKQHGLIQIRLNESETEIMEVKNILLGHEKFNLPTTFCVHHGQAFIIANSQMDNLDQNINQIINPTELTNTYILQQKIKK